MAGGGATGGRTIIMPQPLVELAVTVTAVDDSVPDQTNITFVCNLGENSSEKPDQFFSPRLPGVSSAL